MKLTFLGAAHEVTGSCFYLEACGKRILIEYGMEQGINLFENEPIPVPVSELDSVLLTHAHIDHSGMLPVLYRNGYQGEIHCTEATARLCGIMLLDSAHIQESDAEWRSRKNQRSGREAVEPLYTIDDAAAAIAGLQSHEYGEKFTVVPGVEARMVDVGHLLGSASIEVWVTEEGETRKLVFSGDIGNTGHPILKDPQYVTEADYAIMESTYGDRVHGEHPDYAAMLGKVLQDTFDRGGNVVIPAFAVGRTQELLYHLRQVKAEKLVSYDFPVYVDSPLAIEATEIFGEMVDGYYDPEAMALIREGVDPIRLSNLHVAVSSEESKEINADSTPKVILSASGMCEAGRIRHHLKHNLWRPESMILFVGYQSRGTLGRSLIEGARRVKLFGESIEVRAAIQQLPGVSGHADMNGLMTWAKHIAPPPKKIFVIHGEDTVCAGFAQKLRDELGVEADAPYSGTSYDLLTGECLYAAQPRPLAQPSIPEGNTVYDHLTQAAARLQQLVREKQGYANKDLRQLTREITELCDKWED